jgi:hypothetical protein
MSPSLVALFLNQAELMIEQLNPQDIANTLCSSVALLTEVPTSFVERVSQLIIQSGFDGFSPQNVASTLGALAKSGAHLPWELLMSWMRTNFHRLSLARDAAEILRAVAKMSGNSADDSTSQSLGTVESQVVNAVQHHVAHFTGTEIAMTVWAFAMLHVGRPNYQGARAHAWPTVACLLRQAVAIRNNLGSQDCSTMLWGFSHLRFIDVESPLHFRALAERTLELVPFFETASGVDMTLQALTKIEMDHPGSIVPQLAKALTDKAALMSAVLGTLRRSIHHYAKKLDCGRPGHTRIRTCTHTPILLLAKTHFINTQTHLKALTRRMSQLRTQTSMLRR